MRVALSLIALMLTTGASPPADVPPEPTPGAMTAQADPRTVCRERIQLVRQERGLPKLQRDTAQSDEPLLIAAVEKRIGGCSVLVMRDNLSDVRPLPTPEGPARLQRIR